MPGPTQSNNDRFNLAFPYFIQKLKRHAIFILIPAISTTVMAATTLTSGIKYLPTSGPQKHTPDKQHHFRAM